MGSASKNPAGSNHGSCSRSSMSRTVHRPCSGWLANARLFSAVQASSSPPTTKGRMRMPSGTTSSGSGSFSDRRICQSDRVRWKPKRSANRAPAGGSPCAHSLIGTSPATVSSLSTSAAATPTCRSAGATANSTPVAAGSELSTSAYPLSRPSRRASRCCSVGSGSGPQVQQRLIGEWFDPVLVRHCRDQIEHRRQLRGRQRAQRRLPACSGLGARHSRRLSTSGGRVTYEVRASWEAGPQSPLQLPREHCPPRLRLWSQRWPCRPAADPPPG